VDLCHSQGTTAFTVADNDGNAVAVTQTLGTWGGNFYVTPGLGFLSNDKLTSYGTDPTQYGSRLAFARHGSTITPTIVFKGKKLVFAVGAAGNNWITSAVFETLLGALDYGMGPQQALELPRFIPGAGFGGGGGGRGAGAGATGAPGAPIAPGNPGAAGGGRGAAATAAKYNIEMEDGFSPDVIKRLRELGYDISFVSMRGELREGYGAAVAIDGKKVTAGADPRRAGAAGAIP
jgi:gamma-glutamyltranspeptidase